MKIEIKKIQNESGKLTQLIDSTGLLKESIDSSLPWVILQYTADGDKKVVGTYKSEQEAKTVASQLSTKYPKYDAGEFVVKPNTPELAKTI
jgi:hypothetical protein